MSNVFNLGAFGKARAEKKTQVSIEKAACIAFLQEGIRRIEAGEIEPVAVAAVFVASCGGTQDGWAVPKKDFRLSDMTDAIDGLRQGYVEFAEPKKLL